MRSSHRGLGYVINSYALSDTSLIVHLFLQQQGIIKVVAKGAKSPKSPFAGTLDLFNQVELLYLEARGSSDLHTLSELQVQHRPAGLRASYHRLLLASYYSALLEYWMDAQTDNGETYALFTRALSYADSGELRWRGVAYYEEELSALLGYSKRPEEVYKLHQASPKLAKLREQLSQQLRP